MSRVKNQKKVNNRRPKVNKKHTTTLEEQLLLGQVCELFQKLDKDFGKREAPKTNRDVLIGQRLIQKRLDDVEALVPVIMEKFEELTVTEIKARQLREEEQQAQLETLQRQLKALQLEKEERESQQRQQRIEQQHRYPTKEESKYDEKIKEGDHDVGSACIICFENRRVCSIQPCKHFSLCISCASMELSECPQCRTPITCIERQFL